MKNIVSFIFLLFALVLFLPQVAFSAEGCESQMGQYVIRGDFTANYIGARLWRLTNLKNDAIQNKSCAQEIFNRALDESDKYWTHIDKKFNCSVFEEGMRKVDTCSDTMKANVLSNKAYLTFVRLEGKEKGICNLAGESNLQVLSSIANLSLNETGKALQKLTAPINKCDKIPLSDRMNVDTDKGAKDDLFANLTKGLSSCVAGLFSGFFKEGILKSIQSIWNTLTDPWGTLGALQEIAKAFIKDPAGTVNAVAKNIVNSLYNSFLARYENFDCYSSAKKSEIMCSSMGHGAAAVVEMLVGAQAFKLGSKIVKSFTKAKSINLISVDSEQLKALPGSSGQRIELPGSETGKKVSTLSNKITSTEQQVSNTAKEPVGRVESKETNKNAIFEKKSAADVRKEKIEKQMAARDPVEEGRIRNLSSTDDLARIKAKLNLPSSYTDSDVLNHLKKTRSKYHPDKEIVPPEIADEISKIVLGLKYRRGK